MTTSYAGFCRSMDWTLDISWVGQAGYHELDDDRRARLNLGWYAKTGPGYAGRYNGMGAKIISKHHGEIDHNSFRFDDYRDELGRADNRRDYPRGRNDETFVVESKDWDWYIARPRTTRPFVEAVEGWIDLYR